MLPRLYLIRHGETEWSLSGQHTSHTEKSLTKHGEDQARLLKKRLRGAAFAHVFTSPRARAQRTCELAGLGALAKIEPDLAEWNYGDYEGLRTAEIRSTQPDWNIFLDGCPGGESPEQISDRADRLIARLRQFEGDIALFTHGHFGRVLATRWIGQPVAQGQHFLLTTASLSILAHEHSRVEEPVITLWNASAHEISDSAPHPRPDDASALKQRALERWENEGGEVPAVKTVLEHKKD